MAIPVQAGPGNGLKSALPKWASRPGAALKKLSRDLRGSLRRSAADETPRETDERLPILEAKPRDEKRRTALPEAAAHSASTVGDSYSEDSEDHELTGRQAPSGGSRTSGGTSGKHRSAGGFEWRPAEVVRRAGARFRRALVLEFAGARVVFHDAESFEFALASRTFLPAHTLMALYSQVPEDLAALAFKARLAEERISEAIWIGIDKPRAMQRLVERLDPKLFSSDHDWRDLVGALMQKDASADKFKRLALVNYLRYLASRQDVLRSVYHAKTGVHVFPHESEPLVENACASAADPAQAKVESDAMPAPARRQSVFGELIGRALDDAANARVSGQREPLLTRAYS